MTNYVIPLADYLVLNSVVAGSLICIILIESELLNLFVDIFNLFLYWIYFHWPSLLLIAWNSVNMLWIFIVNSLIDFSCYCWWHLKYSSQNWAFFQEHSRTCFTKSLSWLKYTVCCIWWLSFGWLIPLIFCLPEPVWPLFLYIVFSQKVRLPLILCNIQ